MARFDLDKLDRRSYNLGMIYAFAEVVGSGVKRIGLSPPLTEEVIDNLSDLAGIETIFRVTKHMF